MGKGTFIGRVTLCYCFIPSELYEADLERKKFQRC